MAFTPLCIINICFNVITQLLIQLENVCFLCDLALTKVLSKNSKLTNFSWPNFFEIFLPAMCSAFYTIDELLLTSRFLWRSENFSNHFDWYLVDVILVILWGRKSVFRTVEKLWKSAVTRNEELLAIV